MEIGIFILRVAADCRVQGRDWTLPGVAHLQAQLAITPAILTHLPLNISTLVPQELLQTRLEHPDWQALPQIEDQIKCSGAQLDIGHVRPAVLVPLGIAAVFVVAGCSSHWLCALAMVEVSGSPVVETSPWSPEGGSQTSNSYNSWSPLDRNHATREGR